jgi:hypothetical protein
MMRILAVSSALLATGVHAAYQGDRIHLRSEDVLERSYDEVLSRFIEKRQTVASGPLESTVVLNPDGSLNMTAWDEETSIACTEALSHLELASNPSGTCICYNLPSLDTSTGVFEADLRLYKVSEPSGAFDGIPPQNIQVGLAYKGASVSPVSASRIGGRSLSQGTEFPIQRRAVTPELLQAYLFVGQIDATRMQPEMSM